MKVKFLLSHRSLPCVSRAFALIRFRSLGSESVIHFTRSLNDNLEPGLRTAFRRYHGFASPIRRSVTRLAARLKTECSHADRYRTLQKFRMPDCRQAGTRERETLRTRKRVRWIFSGTMPDYLYPYVNVREQSGERVCRSRFPMYFPRSTSGQLYISET